MPKLRNWSNVSAPCRLEWGPSRWLVAILSVLGPFAAIAVLASGVPRLASMPLAVVALAYGLWLGRNELRRPVRCLIIAPGDGASSVDGEPMTDLELQWRGPLAFLRWRDAAGRRQRLSGWPDTLDARARRELRLALSGCVPAQPARSMAT